jgi:hypothetical protein
VALAGAAAKAAVVPEQVVQQRTKITTPATGRTPDPGPPRAIDTRRRPSVRRNSHDTDRTSDGLPKQKGLEVQEINTEDLEYVGFWPRAGAALIDTLLLLLICMPLVT